MSIPLFIFLLFGLQAICSYVAVRSSKGLKTQDDYFLAGKGVRFFPLLMTFIATVVGGGYILGSAEEAYLYGWSVLLYPLGGTLGFILMGLGVGRRLAELPISTTAQIFEVVYRSPALKKAASLLSIVTLFLILVAQIVGSSKFMASLGVNSELVFIAFWSIVIFYTAVGGLKAVVATDIIQATYFIVAFSICFVCILVTTETPVQTVVDAGINSADFAFDSSKLCGWLLMPLLFMVIEQDIAQRCFAADSPKTVTKATLWAGLCTMLISIIPIYLGILAKNSGIVIPEGGSVLMETIMQTTNPYITALVACAIVAAIISTADSIINAIGSNLALDFNLLFLNNKQLKTSQAISVGISITGLLISFYFNNIVDLLIVSYELSVSCLFAPIFIALFWKKGSALSAALAMAFGAIGFIVFKINPPPVPKEIINLLLSFAGFSLGEILAALYRPQTEVEAYE